MKRLKPEKVILPEAEKKAYDRFERDRVMEFKESEGQTVAASAAALMTILSAVNGTDSEAFKTFSQFIWFVLLFMLYLQHGNNI